MYARYIYSHAPAVSPTDLVVDTHIFKLRDASATRFYICIAL